MTLLQSPFLILNCKVINKKQYLVFCIEVKILPLLTFWMLFILIFEYISSAILYKYKTKQCNLRGLSSLPLHGNSEKQFIHVNKGRWIHGKIFVIMRQFSIIIIELNQDFKCCKNVYQRANDCAFKLGLEVKITSNNK